MKFYLPQKQDFKNLQAVLQSIYGINSSIANLIIVRFGFALDVKLGFVRYNLISFFLKECLSLIFPLTRQKLLSMLFFRINKHLNVGSYRGLRRKLGLPLNGQRTHTNARTSRRLFKKSAFEQLDDKTKLKTASKNTKKVGRKLRKKLKKRKQRELSKISKTSNA